VTGTVATGLDAPWGLAFLPDGDALVSERDRGRIVRVSRSGRITAVGNVAGVDPGGEGGLLGLALSPRFAQDRLLYAYFTAATDNRLVRMRYDTNGQLGAPQVILDGLAKATIHNGGRIAFGPDGYLYVGTGDAAFPARAQDRSSLNGKILRMTSNGRPAPGNPFGSPVFSLGHRNVQGLAWDSGGRLWASEFGQNRYDELNLITAGRNYGWPEVEGPGGSGGFVAPQAWWSTAVASPSGVEVAGGAAYLAALRGARLWQVPIVGGRAGQPRAFFVGTYGRLRTVELAPDGSLWLMTSNTDGRGSPRTGDDKILRVALE
jgi:glucose/arabinose dehydrogenase